MNDSIHIPGGGYRFCHCTNQCQICGACCAIGCEHRAVGHPGSTTSTTIEIDIEEDMRRVRDRIQKLREAIADAPTLRHGWICPMCGAGCAPNLDVCPCTQKEPNR